MGRRLVECVYEDLVTIELAQALAVVRESKALDLVALWPADAHVVLSRFLRAEIERALEDLQGAREERLAQQVALTNDILKLLVARRLASAGQLVQEPPLHLRGIFPHTSIAPGRPETPLAESTILTVDTVHLSKEHVMTNDEKPAKKLTLDAETLHSQHGRARRDQRRLSPASSASVNECPKCCGCN